MTAVLSKTIRRFEAAQQHMNATCLVLSAQSHR
jgi:hypothetical protein